MNILCLDVSLLQRGRNVLVTQPNIPPGEGVGRVERDWPVDLLITPSPDRPGDETSISGWNPGVAEIIGSVKSKIYSYSAVN